MRGGGFRGWVGVPVALVDDARLLGFDPLLLALLDDDEDGPCWRDGRLLCRAGIAKMSVRESERRFLNA